MLADVHADNCSTLVLKPQRQGTDPVLHDFGMDKQTRKNLARNVKRFRELARLDQTELGTRAGIGQTTVSSVEKESGKSPTLVTLDSIAAALGIPTWTLLIDTDQMDKEQVKTLDSIVRSFVKIPGPGQDQINRVAEAEMRYAKTG